MHAVLVNTLVGNGESSFSNDTEFISPELESDFFSNFTCCGENLPSLHDLVKHYEECHIRFEEDMVYSSSCSSSGFQGSIKNTGNGNHKSETGALFSSMSSSDEDELRAFSVSPILPDHHHHEFTSVGRSFSAAPHYGTQQQQQQQRNSQNNSRKRKHLCLDFDEAGDDQDSSAFNNTILRRHDGIERNNRLMNSTSALSSKKVQMIRNFLGFYNENSLSEAFDEEEHNSRIYSILTAASANTSGTPASGAALSMEYDSVTFPVEEANGADLGAAASETSEGKEKIKKPYACTVPGCEKSYKNPNGLKYHMIHGHCIGSPSTANGENGSSSQQNKIIDRPYVCPVVGCGKRYKNRNGLSYHISHSHPSAAGVGIGDVSNFSLDIGAAGSPNSPSSTTLSPSQFLQ